MSKGQEAEYYLRHDTIVVIEDNDFIRTSIISLLRMEFSDWQLLSATSADDLPTVIVGTVRLAVIDIAETGLADPIVTSRLARIRSAYPNAEIGLLCDRPGPDVLFDALRMDIRGVFAKSQSIETTLAAIRIVLSGGISYPRTTAAGSADSRQTSEREPAACRIDSREPIAFTPRELEVLDELSLGRSNKIIAARLTLSEHTVKMHIQHIMRKLRARNRTEVVVRMRSTANAPALAGRQLAAT